MRARIFIIGLVALVMVCGLRQRGDAQGTLLDVADVLGAVNRDCTRFRITGACLCSLDEPCVIVEYWEPLYAVTTVKITGKPLLSTGVLEAFGAESGALLSEITALFGLAGFPGGGAANTAESGKTNLHFNEARVYRIPTAAGLACGVCQNDTQFAVHYLSDIDPLWRRSQVSGLLPGLPRSNPLGVWAPLFPRIGFVIHGSEPVAAVAAATRALHIAANPITTLPNPETRPVIQPAEAFSTCFQLGWPTQKPCLPTGTHPALWEDNIINPTGEHLWFFWVRRACCVLPEQAVCAAVIGGASGVDNYCPVGLGPLGIVPTLPRPGTPE